MGFSVNLGISNNIMAQDTIVDSLKIDSIITSIPSNANYIITEGTGSDLGYDIWIPFLSAFIGGVLVLAGQYIDRRFRRQTESRNNLREIYANCRKLEENMKNNYRELAMFKLHAEYWWYCHNTRPKNDYQKKFYQDHLESQASAREVERKIGENKAEFIGRVREFQVLNPIANNVEELLENISDLTHRKAKSYDFSLKYEEVRNKMVERDERELRDEYFKNLKPLVHFHFME